MNRLVLILLVVFSFSSVAQTTKQESTLRQWLKYWNLASVSEDSIKSWSALIRTGENINLSIEERRKALTRFHLGIYNAGKKFQISERLIKSHALANSILNTGTTLQWPEETTTFAKEDQSANVIKIGKGKRHIIVLPAFGYDDIIYKPLFEEMEDATYHFFIAPGLLGSAPYKLPEQQPLSEATWLKSAGKNLSSYLQQQKINEFSLWANGNGTFLLPFTDLKKIKHIIILNGTVSLPMASSKDPSAQADANERRSIANNIFPANDLLNSATAFTIGNSFETVYSPDRKLAKQHITRFNGLTKAYVNRRYILESLSLDLTDFFQSIALPVIAINPLGDDAMPNIFANRRLLAQWHGVSLKNSPIRIEKINGRDFFFHEHASAVAEIIKEFEKNKLVVNTASDKEIISLSQSPAEVISTIIKTTKITIAYSSPAVKGREIFNKLVPYNKVWRAGANDATKISFSKDVRINGQKLSKGEYSLFVIPTEGQWTFIFNRVADQWGAFQYDESYDALRVSVIPVKATFHEWLNYSFNNRQETSIDLTLSWENLSASITIDDAFELPLASSRIQSYPWKTILDDAEKDINNPALADGKSLSYYFDAASDSLWFKFDLYTKLDLLSPAFTLSFDTDNDQTTGTPWYGTNKSFKTDLMQSVGVTRKDDRFDGYIGLTDAQGIKKSDWLNVKERNVSFHFDPDNNSFYIGVKRSHLNTNGKQIGVIGSVGNSFTWNDDIGADGKYAIIDLK